MKKYMARFMAVLIVLMAAVSILHPLLGTIQRTPVQPEEVQPQAEEEDPGLLSSLKTIKKHGNIVLEISASELLENGFEFGDIIGITVLGTEYEMPVCHNYSEVEEGRMALIADTGEQNDVTLAINYGSFAEYAGIAQKEITEEEPGYVWNYPEGVSEPVEVRIRMKEKGGYAAQLSEQELTRTNNRDDYADLSDAEYANFRKVILDGLKDHILYRSSSPIDPALSRSKEADQEARKAGIRSIVNLAEGAVQAASYEGFDETYYASANILYADLGYDWFSGENEEKIANVMRFIGEQPGPYLIHCKEGKDRTGFIVSLLECLAGAAEEDIVRDYMITYQNFYRLEQTDPMYERVASNNIRSSLAKAFGIESIENADLKAAAENFLKRIGLSESEISSLKKAILR